MSAPANPNYLDVAKDGFRKSITAKEAVLADEGLLQTLVAMAEHISKSIEKGGKLLLCGNGGSAADAQHLAAELIVRLRPTVNRSALPALTLAMDSSTMTACSNDYGYDDIFARPLEALGRADDILLGITTSGKSPNVRRAFEQAKTMGIPCLGFLGGDGGPALSQCDLAFVVPSPSVAQIQECHITAGHILIELIEEMCLAAGTAKTK